ncbi:MAG: hypothetical protein WCT31_02495, partial [Candidatus Micrarchaeia archaeon]
MADTPIKYAQESSEFDSPQKVVANPNLVATTLRQYHIAGDTPKTEQTLSAIAKCKDSDLEKKGYTKSKILNEAAQGMSFEQKYALANLAREAGFTTKDLMLFSLSDDKQNRSYELTSRLAIENAQFAQQLMQMLNEYLKTQADDKSKERLSASLDKLAEMGIGLNQVKNGENGFQKLLKDVSDVLKTK